MFHMKHLSLISIKIFMIITLPSQRPITTPAHIHQDRVGSYILHERADYYHWQGQGYLSIKTFFSGCALYTLGQGYHIVDDRSYLIVNQDQPYSIEIDAAKPVESFCIFIEPTLIEDTHRSLINDTSYLLDEPISLLNEALHFFERTYEHDIILSPALSYLHAHISQKKFDHGWLLEQVYSILPKLLHVHYQTYKEIASLPATRVSTRQELYRRLYRARDYMLAYLDQPLTVPEIARIASLSPSHFIRTFKQVFQQTPHQYLTQKRLERAQLLLSKTDEAITTICFALGFESLSSFSWLFQQRIGCSPSVYRAQKSYFEEVDRKLL